MKSLFLMTILCMNAMGVDQKNENEKTQGNQASVDQGAELQRENALEEKGGTFKRNARKQKQTFQFGNNIPH